MLSFFPRGVLDEILNLIESVSEDFLSYFSFNHFCDISSGYTVKIHYGCRIDIDFFMASDMLIPPCQGIVSATKFWSCVQPREGADNLWEQTAACNRKF